MPGPDCHCALPSRNSEEEKPFASGNADLVGDFGNMRQGSPLEGGHRILQEESAGFFFAKLFTDKIERGLEFEWASASIVSVASYDVNQAVSQPSPGIFFGPGSENTHQGARRHLYEAPETYPLRKPRRLQSEDGVALRMSNHRP